MDIEDHKKYIRRVRDILEHPMRHKWTVQGLGKMQTYLSPDTSLHIWDEKLQYCGTSGIHDHPWHFESTVICGKVVNVRYGATTNEPSTHRWHYIDMDNCTPEGGQDIRLFAYPGEVYMIGDTYIMASWEIHETAEFTNGTVTIVTRDRGKDDRRARVFWPLHDKWTDAKPQAPSLGTIIAITQRALGVLRCA